MQAFLRLIFSTKTTDVVHILENIFFYINKMKTIWDISSVSFLIHLSMNKNYKCTASAVSVLNISLKMLKIIFRCKLFYIWKKKIDCKVKSLKKIFQNLFDIQSECIFFINFLRT